MQDYVLQLEKQLSVKAGMLEEAGLGFRVGAARVQGLGFRV